MAEIIFFLALSAGGAFGASKFDKRSEEIFPISCMGIVLGLFLCGIAGVLGLGVYAVLGCAAILWILSVFFVVKNKTWKKFCQNMFTPGLFLILILYLLLIFMNKGRLAAETDEFSHWIDCVKEMMYLNDFVSNPASGSMFMSYPPSMALFQYFYQKIFFIFSPQASFSEWRCFLAFQLLNLSLFTPVFRRLSVKRFFELCVCVFTIVVMPMFFFAAYTSILIDPFVGMLTGAGCSRIFLEKKKDFSYILYMILLLPVLALAKDAGQYFAAFIGVYFAYDLIISKRTQGRISVKDIITALSPMAAFIIARLLWKIELVTSKTPLSFGGKKVDLVRYGKLILTGGGEGFEKKSISSFIDSFFEKGMEITALDLKINYFSLLILCVFLIYAAYKLLEKYEPEKTKLRVFMTGGLAIQTLLYVYSLGATYISSFSEAEAENLAGYGRYMDMGYLPLWIVVLMSFLYYLTEYRAEKRVLLAAFAVIFLLVSPMEGVTHMLMRKHVRSSVSFREPYNDISNKIAAACEKGSRIAFIDQNPEPDDSFLIVRFNARPDCQVKCVYDLGRDSDGNLSMPAEKMKNTLIKSFDYVVTYQLGEGFAEDYGELFENPDDISEEAVYRVDKTTGMMSICR